MILDFGFVNNLRNGEQETVTANRTVQHTLLLGRNILKNRIVTAYDKTAMRVGQYVNSVLRTETILINATWEPTAAGASVRELLLKISPAPSTTVLMMSRQEKRVSHSYCEAPFVH